MYWKLFGSNKNIGIDRVETSKISSFLGIVSFYHALSHSFGSFVSKNEQNVFKAHVFALFHNFPYFYTKIYAKIRFLKKFQKHQADFLAGKKN